VIKDALSTEGDGTLQFLTGISHFVTSMTHNSSLIFSPLTLVEFHRHYSLYLFWSD
jgi:hypothetical protein